MSQKDETQINHHEPTQRLGEQVAHRTRKEIHGHLVRQHALAVSLPQQDVYRAGVTQKGRGNSGRLDEIRDLLRILCETGCRWSAVVALSDRGKRHGSRTRTQTVSKRSHG